MPQKSIVRINSDSPEHAANITAMLAQNYAETGIRAVQDGRTIALVTDNPFLFDLVSFPARVFLRIKQLLKSAPSVDDKAARA